MDSWDRYRNIGIKLKVVHSSMKTQTVMTYQGKKRKKTQTAIKICCTNLININQSEIKILKNAHKKTQMSLKKNY